MTLIHQFVTSYLIGTSNTVNPLLCRYRSHNAKETRPITVLTAEELDALDDATFAELAADEECLHQALEDCSTIRSGQALSIAKTKTLRGVQKPIL